MTGVSTDEAIRVALDSWLVTDVGMVRDHNEDSAFMESGQGFFIVADGMGGHAAGEVASAMAVETVQHTLAAAQTEIEAFRKAPSDAGRRGLVQLLQNAVLQAHQAVFQRGQAEPDKAGMGTTLDVVLVAGAEAFVAHVGDSRTYLIRDGRSSQITTDHTVAEVLVIEGKLTIEEAQVSPLRTILVNAIGVSADVGVEMAHVTLKRGDRLLLCSDGLHDYFPIEEEVAQRLSADQPGDALAEMVELAKERGGHDNITGIVVLVADVVDAVPAQLSDESTQPVDLVASTFGADEPTQTAFPTPVGPDASATQPVRGPGAAAEPEPRAVASDLAHATTLPPPIAEAEAAAAEAAAANGTPSEAKAAEPERPKKPRSGRSRKTSKGDGGGGSKKAKAAEPAKSGKDDATLEEEPANGGADAARPADAADGTGAKADGDGAKADAAADAAPVAELSTADTAQVAGDDKD